MGPGMVRRSRRRGRRRGLIVGAAAGAAVARHNNAGNQSTYDEPDNGENISLELQQLGQLHDDGILTDEEFQAKKRQLLGL